MHLNASEYDKWSGWSGQGSNPVRVPHVRFPLILLIWSGWSGWSGSNILYSGKSNRDAFKRIWWNMRLSQFGGVKRQKNIFYRDHPDHPDQANKIRGLRAPVALTTTLTTLTTTLTTAGLVDLIRFRALQSLAKSDCSVKRIWKRKPVSNWHFYSPCSPIDQHRGIENPMQRHDTVNLHNGWLHFVHGFPASQRRNVFDVVNHSDSLSALMVESV